MKVLFDHCVPAPLRRALVSHIVVVAGEMGWEGLQNGDLIRAADDAGFDLFISSDRNLLYQQKRTGRRMAILILSKQNWPAVRPHAVEIRTAVNEMKAGEFRELVL